MKNDFDIGVCAVALGIGMVIAVSAAKAQAQANLVPNDTLGLATQCTAASSF